MKKIRILHTICRIYSGGVEQSRLMLIRSLPKDIYEHAVICQEALGVLPGLIADEGCPIREIGVASHILSPSWHNKAYDFAAHWKPDIVHGAVIEGVALACGIGLRMSGTPVVSEETSDPVDRSWRGNLLMRAMCLRSNAVIGVSPVVGDYLRNVAHVPDRKIRVINNAVTPAPVVSPAEISRLRGELRITPSDRIIGSVGRMLDSPKRFSDLIRAMVLVRKKFGAKLLLIGDGPDLSMLQSLAKELNVDDCVVFAGYQGDIRKFYPLMDIFALASEHEAFGLVLVEAMLAGVPVVATRVGGIPFVLDKGDAGILVPPRSPEAMANEIARLLGDEDRRVKLGLQGKERAEREFQMARYGRDIGALYRSLLS